MSIKINTEFFLACMLRNRDTVTSHDINKYADKVYSHLKGKHLILDICRGSIYGAIQGSPDVFCLKEEGVISKRDNSDKYFEKTFILEHLGRSLDDGIRNDVFDLAEI